MTLSLTLFSILFIINSVYGQPDMVDTVHIVFSNHLDFGYTDSLGQCGNNDNCFASSVANRYFDIYFNQAIQVAKNMSTKYNVTYTWMTFPFLASLYLNCPSNMKLHCPNQTAINSFKNGIKSKYIWFNTFPFNACIEMYDKSMFEFGLKLSRDIIKQTNAINTTVLSQRDVPGITRSAIPILKQNKIRAISVGSNGGSAPPATGKISRWFDPMSNETIFYLQHPGGYGGWQLHDTVYLNNFNHALVMAWNSDNKGPMNEAQILSVYNQTRYNFPNAKNIFATTFDTFIDELEKRSDIIQSLPIYDGEIGNTWNYGAASDPFKVSAMLNAQRLRTECLEKYNCSLDSPYLYNFSRFLLKNGEHTWGAAVFAAMGGVNIQSTDYNYYQYTNKEIRDALIVNNSINNMTNMINTWFEQRNWGLYYAMDALKMSDIPSDKWLYNNIQSEWNRLLYVSVEKNLNLNDYKVIQEWNQTFSIGKKYELQFNNNGAIDTLFDIENGIEFASETNNHSLGQIFYQILEENDFIIHANNYGCSYLAYEGQGRPDLNNFTDAKHGYFTTSLLNLYQNRKDKNVFIVELDFGKNHKFLFTEYGIPQELYLKFNFSELVSNNEINMELVLINKTFTRMPELLYLSFKVAISPLELSIIDDPCLEKHS
eukprot:439542_1